MRYGLFASVILHVAILAWALFTIQTQQELRVSEPQPIVTGLVTEGELTKLRQGARTAKELEAQPKESPKSDPAKQEAAKPKPVAAAPPPPPAEPPPPPKEAPKEEPKENTKAAAVPPPPPPPPDAPAVPAPDEQKRLADLLKEEERKADELMKKMEEQKKAEEQKRIDEEKRREAEAKKKRDDDRKKKLADLKKKQDDEKKRKEAEAKKQFDAEKIAALLNKVPDKGAPPPSAPPSEAKNKGPALGAPEGRDKTLSASERAVLAQIIRSCVQARWNLSAGGEEAMNVEIKLRLQFRPDGTLAVPPQVTNHQNTPYFLAVSEGAVRAAQACEPYSLPPEKYEAWRDVLMTFSLRDMLR